MKDKIVSFILFLIVVAIMVVMGVFGYVIYKEIVGNEELPIDFEGIRKLFYFR